MDCVFCKIIAGTIPCYKIYEDAEIFCFLDINPANQGHTLIVPKTHHAHFHEVADNTLGAMMSMAKKVTKAQGLQNYNLLLNNGACAGQSVFHPHLHVVPRHEGDACRFAFGHSIVSKEDMIKTAADIAKKL